ncbi:MAG TPA: GGDEF domain-containing protein [Gammaproteobacteria bacterium]|nr:GGDEF domain-containing protein [Gammaproteobacteria bacterium]
MSFVTIPGDIRQDVSDTGPDAPTADALRVGLELTQSLQTTLDLERLMELFADALAGMLDHDGLTYAHPDGALRVHHGNGGAHRCRYRLILAEQPLGELSVHRRRRFSDREIALLENLLCTLLYPLRNALLYRQALDLARTDPLTGAHNRAVFDEALAREVDLAHRHGSPLALVVLDVDLFKSLNDTYGHAHGDRALQRLVQCARQAMRRADLLFRYGGEEFVLVLRNTPAEGAAALAERIRADVEHLRIGPDSDSPLWEARLTVSAGVAALTGTDDPGSLFTRADRALYEAKRAGRNRVCRA